MAFQPIVDVRAAEVFAYEALVRGVNGEPAGQILDLVTPANRGGFDRDCRACAMTLAKRLGVVGSPAALSINMLPQSVGDPANGIEHTLALAEATGFPVERIIFELTEHDRVDLDLLGRIIRTHRQFGFRTAIDDFGAGYSGLGLLARLEPDLVKLDMDLLCDIHLSERKQVIVAGIVGIARELDIDVVAEGVETESELTMLRAAGIALFQGYLFAKPALMSLPRLADEAGARARA